jgi:DNA-binding transcriptional LysR family regulator
MNTSMRHLRAFVALSETGSFTAAGKLLFVTQSALTKSIGELESLVGLRFFERTTRRVELNENGKAFLPVARRLVREFDRCLQDLKVRAGGRSGVVMLACGTSFASAVLPRVIATFRSTHPGVRLSVQDDTSGGVLRRVHSGEAELGIASLVGDFASEVSAKHLLSARIGVLFPPGAEPPRRLDMRALRKLPLLGDASDSSIASLLRQAGFESGEANGPDVEASSIAVQISLVRAGIGPCVLSALGASHPAAAGLPFRLIELPLSREIYLVGRRGLEPTPAAAAFADAIEKVLPTIELAAGVTVGKGEHGVWRPA